jgi:Protein of unknown function (DUF3732)
MEGAAPDGNRGPNGGRPRRCAPLPPPAAAPGPPFPQALAKRLPAPRRARPPPPTLAVSHTFHSPGDDESYTLIGKNRTPLGWVTFQPLAWVSFRALPAQAAVARLYRLLWEYCNQYTPSMQIIVTDHVELLQDWFRISIVQRWRDGIKLVPVTWLR